MEAKIVLGLGFGDEGKGLTTSYLCSQNQYKSKIVLRFSGGQQAGHTVIKDGIKHIHSNFGSGTLNGVPSYFTEHCTVYPNTISREKLVLKNKGITPQLFVHPLTKVTTPSDVAFNRIREKKMKHGSCGLGIGATMKRNDTTGFKLYAIDTLYPAIFNQKVKNISDYYKSIIDNEDLKEFERIEKQEMELFKKTCFKSFKVEDYLMLIDYDELIFEGSQGILLDMDHGVFPNVTYANTTSKNAIELCKKFEIDGVEIYYVTRCYQTRHGNGWMSNRKKIDLINTEEEINVYNEWQQNFKTGEIDYDLLNYAISLDSIYSEEIICSRNLVVTCQDQRPDFSFDFKKMKAHFDGYYGSKSPISDNIFEITKF